MTKQEVSNCENVLKDLGQTPAEEQHNLVYDNDEEEPELHARTWMACAAMLLLNFVLTFALQGPPVVVSGLDILRRNFTNGTLIQALYHRERRQWCPRTDLGAQCVYSYASRVGAHC